MNIRQKLLAGGCALAMLPIPFIAHHHPPHPPGPPGPPPHGHDRASITQLSPSHLMGLAQRDGWQKLVQVEPTTWIHRGPQRLDVSALQVGLQVHVHDHAVGNGPRVADDVDILPQFESFGRVLQVGPSQVSIQGDDGLTYLAMTAPDCRVHCRMWSVPLDQVHPGERARVAGEPTGAAILAHDLDFPEHFGFWHFLLLPSGLGLAGLGAWRALRKKKVDSVPGLRD